MLIDDNSDDNFFHERIIRKNHAADSVVTRQNANSALDYLTSLKNQGSGHPDLIFLDINMPGMNGWEFLEAYNKIDKRFHCEAIVVMLTTSCNPDDELKARESNVASDFKTKPLTQEMLEEIINKHFPATVGDPV